MRCSSTDRWGGMWHSVAEILTCGEVGFSFTSVLLHAWYTTMITIFYYVVVCLDIIHDRNNQGASPFKHGDSEERMKWPNIWQNERKLSLVFNKAVCWCWRYGRAHLWNHTLYVSCVQMHLHNNQGYDSQSDWCDKWHVAWWGRNKWQEVLNHVSQNLC